jgi:hypothetical protein
MLLRTIQSSFCLDTKETKSQGFFIFLTPKLRKIAKHKKLAFSIHSPLWIFEELRSFVLELIIRFGSHTFLFFTPFCKVLTKNEKADLRWSLIFFQSKRNNLPPKTKYSCKSYLII